MKPEDKKRLIISIGMIILLGGISFWRFRNYDPSKINVSFPRIDSSGIENLESLFDEENLERVSREMGISLEETEVSYKRKTINDLLSFDYPSSWRTSEEKSEYSQKKSEVIFVAYADNAVFPSSISVIKISAENISEVEEVLREDITHKDFILEKESENEYVINIDVEYSENLEGLIRGKIFFLNEEYYVVSVASFKENLATPESINKYIVSSIQIIN